MQEQGRVTQQLFDTEVERDAVARLGTHMDDLPWANRNQCPEQLGLQSLDSITGRRQDNDGDLQPCQILL